MHKNDTTQPFFKLSQSMALGLVLACVFVNRADATAPYRGLQSGDMTLIDEGFEKIEFGEYVLCCDETGGNCTSEYDEDYGGIALIMGFSVDGVDAYKCTDGEWKHGTSYGLCDFNTVPNNTYGNVEECIYTTTNQYNYCTHRATKSDVKYYHKAGVNGACVFRGCADYAAYVAPTNAAPYCERVKSQWLIVGDDAYKCGTSGLGNTTVRSGVIAKKPQNKQEIQKQEHDTLCGDDNKMYICDTTGAGDYWRENGACENASANSVHEVEITEQPECQINEIQPADCNNQIPGAAECENKCINGKWKLYVKSCLDNTYRVAQGGLMCQKITQPTVATDNTDDTDTSTTNCNSQDGCTIDCVTGAESVTFTGGYCIAETCKSNYYKVKKSNVYQGWCQYISCPADQEPNIDAQEMWDQTTDKCRAKQSAETEVVQETTEQPVVAEETSGDTIEGPAATSAAPSGPADGDDCKDKMYKADTATYQNGVCTVHTCYAGFEVKEKQCVEISGPCKSLPDNATRGHRQYDEGTDSVKCIVDDCVDGYVVADDKMSCREDYEALAEQRMLKYPVVMN